MKGISLLGQRINLGAVSLLQAKKLAQYFNETKVFSYNKRSRSYALACGYKHEATLKEVRLRHGVYWDEWILSITKEEWEPIFTLYKNKHYI